MRLVVPSRESELYIKSRVLVLNLAWTRIEKNFTRKGWMFACCSSNHQFNFGSQPFSYPWCTCTLSLLLQKDLELRNLEDEEQQVEETNTKVNGQRMGSDGDSGVLVTGDETFFSTESTTNGEQPVNNSTPIISPTDGTTVDENESTTLWQTKHWVWL